MSQGEHQGLDRGLKKIMSQEEQVGSLFLCSYFNLITSLNLARDYYKLYY